MKPKFYYYILARHSQIGGGLTAPAPLHEGVTYDTLDKAREALIKFLRWELEPSEDAAAEELFNQVRELPEYQTFVVDTEMDGILCAGHDRWEFVIKSFLK